MDFEGQDMCGHFQYPPEGAVYIHGDPISVSILVSPACGLTGGPILVSIAIVLADGLPRYSVVCF